MINGEISKIAAFAAIEEDFKHLIHNVKLFVNKLSTLIALKKQLFQ